MPAVLAPLLTLDTETFKPTHGRKAPKPVCVQIKPFGAAAMLLTPDEGVLYVLDWLEHGGHVLGHNIVYDLAVLVVYSGDPYFARLVWHAFREGRIRCTMIRQMLKKTAAGHMQADPRQGYGPALFGLDALAWELLGIKVTGKTEEDAIRFRYHELDGVPFDLWPDEAVRYALGDVDLTEAVFVEQAREEGLPDEDLLAELLPDELWQVREHWFLHLTGCWGLRTDGPAVAELKERLTKSVDEAYSEIYAQAMIPIYGDRQSGAGPLREVIGNVNAWEATAEECAEAIRSAGKSLPRDKTLDNLRARAAEIFGLVKRKRDGSWGKCTRNVQAAVEAAFAARGEKAPLTKPSDTHPDGQTSASGDTLALSGDPVLRKLAEVEKDRTELSNFVPSLERGAVWPICSYFVPIVANGRTGSRDPNVQNQPRRSGVRECFIPRAGRVFVNVDLSTAELVTLAQVCIDWFGWSRLAEDLLAGRDPHLGIAAQLLGVSYETAEDWKRNDPERLGKARDCGKATNFGAAGMLGVKTFIEFARDTYGIDLDEDEAAHLLDVWREERPEVAGPYFDQISQWCEEGDRRYVRLPDGTEKTIKYFAAALPRSGRIRGGLTATAGANNFFSGPVADIGKRSGFWIAWECFLGDLSCDTCRGLGELDDHWLVPTGEACPDCGGSGFVGGSGWGDGEVSPLYGSRPVNFIHDEHMLESPEDRAPECGDRVAALMVREFRAFCPDLAPACDATPTLQRRWYKKSDTVRDASGRLCVWEPKAKA